MTILKFTRRQQFPIFRRIRSKQYNNRIVSLFETMSSMNFSTSKQFVKPPQRGIFPLDHDAECKPYMEKYMSCLKESNDTHHKCKELSRDYLQCRMDHQLMAKEDLNHLGYSEDKAVVGAQVYDRSKEKAGFIAGKHIQKKGKWWFQHSKKDWVETETGIKPDK
mmetsp:Transcript_21137/g.50236  ORF Transcript_21137/g.50236 Transcript_21137/m.50236 type:complete len:164 (+) Transcript_21137:2341-2832(+)